MPKDAGGTPDFIKKFYKDLKNSSNAKQLTVGAISGWAAGYVASKFGKIAATAIGGSLLLIQVTTVWFHLMTHKLGASIRFFAKLFFNILCM